MRFICDTMLGKLAKRLRILGLDTAYVRSDSDLASFKPNGEMPYFFTKRKVQRTLYGNAVYIESDFVTGQLGEIKKIILPYVSQVSVMKRCIVCNVLLINMNRDDVEGLVPEFVFHKYSLFRTCPSCKKIYWEGSHVKRMQEWITIATSPLED